MKQANKVEQQKFSFSGLLLKSDGAVSVLVVLLAISVPYILCGLAMAFFGPQIAGVHWIIAMLCAVLLGAFWGDIVGFLKAKFEVSEVVATIMLNYIALYLSRIIIMRIPGTNTYKTPDFPKTALIESQFLSKLTNGSEFDWGFFIALGAVVFYWFIMEKTNLGFGLRATGFNKYYSGIDSRLYRGSFWNKNACYLAQ